MESAFLSTPSARRATNVSPNLRYFYPRPPRGGRPQAPALQCAAVSISIHALREEGDLWSPSSSLPRWYFYPRPPRGGRRWRLFGPQHKHPISIHALREEGDCSWKRNIRHIQRFLSTPSARRATPRLYRSTANTGYFYPRPPRGGRRIEVGNNFLPILISIHALREEGDAIPVASASGHSTFLSTPSARRATSAFLFPCDVLSISIHALREEGDGGSGAALPDGGQFLSTPSARRATLSYC